MRHFLPIASFDPVPLLAALARQPELWDRQRLRTTHAASPHTQASDIWIKFNDLAEYERTGDAASIIDQHESIWQPAAACLPQVRPVVFDLQRKVEADRIGRVIITRLAPGKRIAPHVDSGDHAAYYQRYQCVLQNKPGSLFRIGQETVTMKGGEVWWIDNATEHEVQNNSTDDRLTMIVDLHQ